MWLAPAALVLIVKWCFEPQASLLRRVDRAGRSGSGDGAGRCASRSNGQRHHGSAQCAARRLLVQRRRQIQRQFPGGEEVFKEQGRGRRCCEIPQAGQKGGINLNLTLITPISGVARPRCQASPERCSFSSWAVTHILTVVVGALLKHQLIGQRCLSLSLTFE